MTTTAAARLAVADLIAPRAFLGTDGVYRDPDLIGWWPLAGDGTDWSGNGLDGVVSGGVTATADHNGNAGRALAFDGTEGSEVRVPYDPLLDAADAWTATAWARFDAAGAPTALLSRWGTSSNTFTHINTRLQTSNRMSVYTRSADGLDSAGVTSGVLTLGAWHHFAFVFDGAGQTLKLYVDGALNGPTDTFAFTQCMTNTADFVIGRFDFAWTAYRDEWLGAIHDVRLYGRALPAEHVAALAAL